MGTHCHLGIRTSANDILGCYVHYDGYPEHMIPAVRNFLANKTTTCLLLLVRQAQGRGGLVSFKGYEWELSEGMWGPEAYDNDRFGTDVHYRYTVDLTTANLTAELLNACTGEWERVTEKNRSGSEFDTD